MIRLIIFDWDDVFTLGSTKGYFKCYHETLSELGIRLTPEEERKRILAKWGKSQLEELRELLKEKPELLEKAHEIYEEKLFSNVFVDCLSAVSGSQELLERLNRKYIIGIVTGVNPALLKEKIMPKFGFPDVFAQIIFSQEITDPEKQKPHAFMVEQILSQQNVNPSEAVLVGDAKGDVLMAKAAGVMPIVVLTGHLSRKEAEELGVKHIIPDVTHLEKVLDKINI